MKEMVRKETVKKFSCLYCGTPFDAYPPDDRHYKASRNKKDYKDFIQVDYKCRGEVCGKINTIYWGYPSIGAVLF